MDYQKSLRIPVLIALFGGSLLALGKVLLFPPTPPVLANASLFANQPELPDWQFQATTPLSLEEEGEGELITAATYTYEQETYQLNIDMHYLMHMDSYLRNLMLKYGKNTPTVPFETTIQENEFGYYSLFSDAEGTYLSSCINPRGGTTVTDSQFVQNRQIHDLRADRLLPILIGQTTLQDARCVWVHMTLPATNNLPPEKATEILETVWPLWYNTWQLKFPDA